MKRTGSILIVEDDPNDVYFISRAFRGSGLGAPIEVVNDGQAAIDYLSQHGAPAPAAGFRPPCLMVLDLNLPRKTGFEVLKWIRQDSDWRTLAVIVLTSSTADSDIEQAYLLGANSYVIKPGDATELADFARHVKEYWFGWNQLPPMCYPAEAHSGRATNG